MQGMMDGVRNGFCAPRKKKSPFLVRPVTFSTSYRNHESTPQPSIHPFRKSSPVYGIFIYSPAYSRLLKVSNLEASFENGEVSASVGIV